MTATKKNGLRPKAQKQDDSIMGTNNSSIVSKRSVERLYYPHEPHFFRYFVKKPQRRAPLINRGYWLRMKAIDHAVQQFLEESSPMMKLVINLGAGYDPLPWQCLTRYPNACKNVKFIDIDYQDLMVRKRATVMSTPELASMFTNIVSGETDVMLSCDQYLQIGCDLRDTSKLSKILSSVFDLEKYSVMFTAEVSVTYMTNEGADALLQWTSTLPNARFCLLEQLLPRGTDHPFAKTMMSHFNKLQTPLQSVQKYPTTRHQEHRFITAGWKSAKARNLWELWGSPDFISHEERTALDFVEPFDEWEEFALFGSHYFLLIATNSEMYQTPHNLQSYGAAELQSAGHEIQSTEEILPSYSEHTKPSLYRRFATSLPFGDATESFGTFGGLGQSRLNTIDHFASISTKISNNDEFEILGTWPSARMCHTMTDINDDSCLLVGGRNSPSDALADCWIWRKSTRSWTVVQSLPKPLYRHSAVHIGQGKVLVLGGKSDSTSVEDSAYIWTETSGWKGCTSTVDNPRLFGASIIHYRDNRGLYFGGIGNNGLISQSMWFWMISGSEDQPEISYVNQSPNLNEGRFMSSLRRFGATTAIAKTGKISLVGGIIGTDLLPQDQEILEISMNADLSPQITALNVSYVNRPLLIGTCVVTLNNNLVVVGGGAVCFSFGTFWTPGIYSIPLKNSQPCNELEPSSQEFHQWQFIRTIEPTTYKKSTGDTLHLISATPSQTEPTMVPRQTLNSVNEFENIVANGRPVILEQVQLGPCTEVWTNEYLKDSIGSDREVTIHQSNVQQMDFIDKNFTYVKKSFGSFMESISAGGMEYLRSLSAEKPSGEPADIAKDFPSLAKDFALPPEMATVVTNAHSSPLRISGPVNMWLHYDVMANVLCQIRGSKKLLLFPPSDVVSLRFAPGNSSSSVNVFDLHDRGALASAHPHEVTLHPGDILYLPPLWLHTAKPLSGVSISVNVFFRNLQKGYAAGRDVYGNRDLQAYEKGRQDVAKIAKAFSGMPEDMRNFYLLRLAAELREAADMI